MPSTLSNPIVSVSVQALLSGGAAPAPIGSQIRQSPAFNIGAGSTAGNVDRCYSTAFTVSAGTPLTINLISALDPLNNAVGMLHLSSVLVQNNSTTTGQDLVIGGGTHPALGSDQYTAQANGGVAFVCNPNPGFTITSGSSDTLTITAASGSSVSGAITILGRSV